MMAGDRRRSTASPAKKPAMTISGKARSDFHEALTTKRSARLGVRLRGGEEAEQEAEDEADERRDQRDVDRGPASARNIRGCRSPRQTVDAAVRDSCISGCRCHRARAGRTARARRRSSPSRDQPARGNRRDAAAGRRSGRHWLRRRTRARRTSASEQQADAEGGIEPALRRQFVPVPLDRRGRRAGQASWMRLLMDRVTDRSMQKGRRFRPGRRFRIWPLAADRRLTGVDDRRCRIPASPGRSR